MSSNLFFRAEIDGQLYRLINLLAYTFLLNHCYADLCKLDLFDLDPTSQLIISCFPENKSKSLLMEV